MNSIPLIGGIAVVVLLAVPRATHQTAMQCAGLSCASTLDNDGNIPYYYEVEPVGCLPR